MGSNPWTHATSNSLPPGICFPPKSCIQTTFPVSISAQSRPFWLSTHVLVPTSGITQVRQQRSVQSHDQCHSQLGSSLLPFGGLRDQKSIAERLYFPPDCTGGHKRVLLSRRPPPVLAWTLVPENCSLHRPCTHSKVALSENADRQLRECSHSRFTTVTQNSATQREERPGRGTF